MTNKTINVKTSELEGVALDYAVAVCEWCDSDIPQPVVVFRLLRDEGFYYFSSKWSQGGPIIERERIELGSYEDKWAAVYHGESESIQLLGDTALIAAVRCYVASKLGDSVDIPQELIK